MSYDVVVDEVAQWNGKGTKQDPGHVVVVHYCYAFYHILPTLLFNPFQLSTSPDKCILICQS